MPDLPYDVCFIIASHLEGSHLLTLASVNRAFYDIVLDTRYREIWWASLDQPMLRSLAYLQYVSPQLEPYLFLSLNLIPFGHAETRVSRCVFGVSTSAHGSFDTS